MSFACVVMLSHQVVPSLLHCLSAQWVPYYQALQEIRGLLSHLKQIGEFGKRIISIKACKENFCNNVSHMIHIR